MFGINNRNTTYKIIEKNILSRPLDNTWTDMPTKIFLKINLNNDIYDDDSGKYNKNTIYITPRVNLPTSKKDISDLFDGGNNYIFKYNNNNSYVYLNDKKNIYLKFQLKSSYVYNPPNKSTLTPDNLYYFNNIDLKKKNEDFNIVKKYSQSYIDNIRKRYISKKLAEEEEEEEDELKKYEEMVIEEALTSGGPSLIEEAMVISLFDFFNITIGYVLIKDKKKKSFPSFDIYNNYIETYHKDQKTGRYTGFIDLHKIIFIDGELRVSHMDPSPHSTNKHNIKESISEQRPLPQFDMKMYLYYDDIHTHNTEEYYRIKTTASFKTLLTRIKKYDSTSHHIYKSYLYYLEEEEEDDGGNDYKFPKIDYKNTTDTELYDVTSNADNTSACFGFFYQPERPYFTYLYIPEIYINNNNTDYPSLTEYLESVYKELKAQHSTETSSKYNYIYLKKSYFEERMDNRLGELEEELIKESDPKNTTIEKNTLLCALSDYCS